MRRLLPLLLLLLATGCSGSWTFVAFGDSSPSSTTAEMPAAFHHIVKAINQTDAELALFAGDLVYGRTVHRDVTRQQYERARLALKPLRPPLLIVPGNHDIDGAGGQEEFNLHFPAAPWVHKHRGWTFIGLSTEQPGTQGRIEGKQLAFLKKALAARGKPDKTVILMHRPIWPTLQPTHRYHSLPQPELHELFRQSGVTAVISGHEHHFHQQTRDGILYLITGGGGADLLPGGTFHFTRIQVHNSNLNIEKISAF